MPEDKVITQIDLGALAPAEIELVWLIRNKYRYGKIEIEVREGLPTFIARTIERQKVG
jgi:hypothetical protein